MTRKKVVVVGLGYVGLPLAVICAENGLDVIGIDISQSRVDLLTSGQSPVEDISHERIQDLLRKGKIQFSARFEDSRNFDVALLTLPTPLTADAPDVSALISACRELSAQIREGTLVIVESTVFPGCTESLVIPALESATTLRAGLDFMVGYSPERINPGDKEWQLSNTPKVTSGINDDSSKACGSFYSDIGIPTFAVSSVRNAEFTKLLENTFRLVNISLVNELMTVSEDMNVDIWESLEAADSKPFGFVKFTPGPGVGGHCLPIDTVYLSWAVERMTGKRLSIVEAASEVNTAMPSYVASRIVRELQSQSRSTEGANILLLGLAYKAEIGDLREAPSLALAKILTSLGATVWGLDPWVNPEQWPKNVKPALNERSQSFDLGVLMTAHSDGSWTQSVLESGLKIIDTRDYLRGDSVMTLGRPT